MKRPLTFLILELSILLYLLHFPVPCASASLEFECPEKVYQGEPFLVRIQSDKRLESIELSWLSDRVFSSPSEIDGKWQYDFILGTDVKMVRLGSQLLSVRLSSRGVDHGFSWQIQVLDRSYPEERLTVPGNMVSPPEDMLFRIARERELVKKALETSTSETMWELPFLKPLSGDVTSPYGQRRYYNDRPGTRHGGVDFRAAPGTAVKATAEGVVVLTGDHYFAGKSVYIDHGNRVISMYFHLSSITVEQGERVACGDVLGLSGMSGRVTGPHLHFGVCVCGEMVDPLKLLSHPGGGKGVVKVDI
ncbi:MAG: M23 family metallopeptidase [Synergistales bacterium]|nr:M23 family metallopeptidase [Synergistales bacterium]